MLYFGILGYMQSNIANILAPVDSQGRICGYDFEVQDYPYLFLTDLDNAYENPNDVFQSAVCVKDCPASPYSPVECVETAYTISEGGCENFEPRTENFWGNSKGNVYYSLDYHFYCYPDPERLNEDDLARYDSLFNGFAASMLGSWAAEVRMSRWVILTSTGICIALSIINLKLVSCIPTFMAWLSIITMEIGLGFLGYLFYDTQMTRE
jgi:hypothetical protein